MLRLVLPKSIAIRMAAPPSCFPRACVTQKDFRLVLAAIGLLLAPQSPRAQGELLITVESSPTAVIFHPNYPVNGLTPDATWRPESNPAFFALEYRVARLGGMIELFKTPTDARHGSFCLILDASAP